jgi:hypothetical protein
MFENCRQGKCALVTGAFGGLGRHFALTLGTWPIRCSPQMAGI